MRYAHGADALLAFLLTLEGIRAALAATGRSMTWEGGEPGDTGLSCFVPHCFGRRFSQRLEAMTDAEVQREGEHQQD